jgi:hypothetical protein
MADTSLLSVLRKAVPKLHAPLFGVKGRVRSKVVLLLN